MKIFLSHSSQDKPLVMHFKDSLPGFIKTWIDNERVFWGADLKDVLRSTIESSVDFFIIFLSSDSIGADWVQKELEWASQRQRVLDRTFVLPILLPGVSKKDLPTDLSNRKFLQLKGTDESSLKKLAEDATQELFKLAVDSFSSTEGVSHETNNVVLYMPMLHLNPFFSTFLEYFTDRAQRSNFNVIVKKAHNIYLDLNRSVDHFLEDINKGPLSQSIIVLFPPHPEAYRSLLTPERIEEFRDLKVILMDIDPFEGVERPDIREQKLSEAEYIKAVIVLDNQKACELAAKEVIKCVEGQFNYVKVILCDGDYHGRADKFRDAMSYYSSEAKRVDGSEGGILVDYIPPTKPRGGQKKINFANALKDSYEHVCHVLDNNLYLEDVSKCPTFIFCANDVIALGARAALNEYSKKKLKYTVIIAYDGSTLLDGYMNLHDRYVKLMLTQNYDGYTNSLISELNRLRDGRNRTSNKLERINPGLKVSGIKFLRD